MDKIEDIESFYLNKLKSKDFVVFYDREKLEFLFHYGYEHIHCHKNFLSFSVLKDGENYDLNENNTIQEFSFSALERGFRVKQKRRYVQFEFNLKDSKKTKEEHDFSDVTNAIRFFIFQHIKNYSNYKEKKEDKNKKKVIF